MESQTQPSKVFSERILVLVKAQPHLGTKSDETVCCAGLTANGEWRRQYPIHFRRTGATFNRWDWIKYDYIMPRNDQRPESRRVQENTITLDGRMPKAEQARFLERFAVKSTETAANNGCTLALIRPKNSYFYWKKKTRSEIDDERRKNEEVSKQKNLFDHDIVALIPCPYEFRFRFETEDGKSHDSKCGDWETSAMFFNIQNSLGEKKCLDHMTMIFNEKYPHNGMMFALGTHSRYPGSWLLVGIIRADNVNQNELIL